MFHNLRITKFQRDTAVLYIMTKLILVNWIFQDSVSPLALSAVDPQCYIFHKVLPFPVDPDNPGKKEGPEQENGTQCL